MAAIDSPLFAGEYMALLTDGRRIYGHINCIDGRGNLVLGEVAVELPPRIVSPLNAAIEVTNDLRDSKERVYRRLTGRDEVSGEVWNRFWANRFYSSGFIVPRSVLADLRAVDNTLV